MKVKDILKVIDEKQYFELKETIQNGNGSYGFFQKNDLYYNDKLKNKKVVEMFSQKIKEKTILVISIDD